MPDAAGSVLALKIRVLPSVPRVVLDTNLFVAAYWSPRSASARILEACEEDRIRLLVSPAICREVTRILSQARTSRPHRERSAEIMDDAEQIHPTRRVRLVAEDPEDDKFLECALDGGADYIVTNDDHLLSLGEVEGVRIVKPGEFLRGEPHGHPLDRQHE